MGMRYLSCADTAKLIRAALKREFPEVKFSVRSHTYAGGASINVGWIDGPQSADVDAVTGQFAGAGFDGMIDLKTYNQDWLYPDGHVEGFQSEVGHSYGSTTRDWLGETVDPDAARDYAAGVRHTVGDEGYAHGANVGSLAYRAGVEDAQERMRQGAELVHFGADYIFTNRDLSEAASDQLKRAIAYLGGQDPASFDGSRRYEFRAGSRWFDEFGWTLLHQLSHVAQSDLDEALTLEAERRPVSTAPGRALCWVVSAGAWRLKWRELAA